MTIDDSIHFLESRLRDNPKSLIFARLADLYLMVDRVDDAIILCLEGLEHHPAYITANFILSKAYIAKNDNEHAEIELKKVLSHDRQYLAAHKLLGDLMAKMGWENKAALHYRDILRIDPLEENTQELVNMYPFEETILPPAPPVLKTTDPSYTKEKPHPAKIHKEQWENRLEELFPVKDSKKTQESLPEISENAIQEDLDEIVPTIEEDSPALTLQECADEIESVIPDSDNEIPKSQSESVEIDKNLESLNIIEDTKDKPETIYSPELAEDILFIENEFNQDSMTEMVEEKPENDDFNPLLQTDESEDKFSPQLPENIQTSRATELTSLDETISDSDEFIFGPEEMMTKDTSEDLPETVPLDMSSDDKEFSLDFLKEIPKEDTQSAPEEIRLPPPSVKSDKKIAEIEFNPELTDASFKKIDEIKEPAILKEEIKKKIEKEPDIETSSEVPKAVKENIRKPEKEKSSQKPNDEETITTSSEPDSYKAGSDIRKPKSSSKIKKSDKIISPTLGEIYAAQGQYAKAIKVYENLIERNPADEGKYRKKIEELKQKQNDTSRP